MKGDAMRFRWVQAATAAAVMLVAAAGAACNGDDADTSASNTGASGGQISSTGRSGAPADTSTSSGSGGGASGSGGGAAVTTPGGGPDVDSPNSSGSGTLATTPPPTTDGVARPPATVPNRGGDRQQVLNDLRALSRDIGSTNAPEQKERLLERCASVVASLRGSNDPGADDLSAFCASLAVTDPNGRQNWDEIRAQLDRLIARYEQGG
jgi:hypothetical protein